MYTLKFRTETCFQLGGGLQKHVEKNGIKKSPEFSMNFLKAPHRSVHRCNYLQCDHSRARWALNSRRRRETKTRASWEDGSGTVASQAALSISANTED